MRNKFVAWSLMVGLLVAPLVSITHAQAPRDGAMRMRARNNGKMRLSQVWRGIRRLERSATPLSKDQARKVVALVRPWGNRPTMNEAQATALATRISAVLSARQKSELAKARRMNRRERGGRPRGERGDRARREGGDGMRRERRRGGSGGQQMGQMRASMQKMRGIAQTMNPFYPPSKYREIQSLPPRMREGLNRYYQSSHEILVALVRKAG